MQLPNSIIVFSALLSLGTAMSSGPNPVLERAICSGPKCGGSPNAIDAGDKPAASPSAGKAPAKAKGINCDLLLRQDTVNCTGLSAKTCDLISWMYAKSGAEAKTCCDNAERLPFGAGVYYTGYMRACAPQYQLKRFDRPAFIDRPCSANRDCTFGLSKGLCDMYSWENAGCQQRATCDATIKSASELPECCKQWPNKPQRNKGLFSQLYQSRFDLKCPST
ncbi:hypothetical protein PWT90_04034 [Aphanocladium album]|nr:hypothetical protein PWT90_04034 [Aphanocladium album]